MVTRPAGDWPTSRTTALTIIRPCSSHPVAISAIAAVAGSGSITDRPISDPDPAQPPIDRARGADISGWRDRSAYAIPHGRNSNDRERRDRRRVCRATSSLHRAHAELCRSHLLRHNVRPAAPGLDGYPVRVDTLRLRSRGGIAHGNIPQAGTLTTNPRGLRPFSG